MVELIQVPRAGAYYRDALRYLTYAALSVPQPLPAVAIERDSRLPELTISACRSVLATGAQDSSLPSRRRLGIAVSDKVGASPTDNGPAAKAGVIAGDVITEIDNASHRTQARYGARQAAGPAHRSGSARRQGGHHRSRADPAAGRVAQGPVVTVP